MRCFKRPWRISGIAGLIRHVSSFASAGGDSKCLFQCLERPFRLWLRVPQSGFDSEDRYSPSRAQPDDRDTSHA